MHGGGVLVVFPACDASLVLGVGEVEARVEHPEPGPLLGGGPAEDVHTIPVTDRMLFTLEELLREPLRVSPPGQPLGELLRGGVVEGDGLLITEEEGAGSVDEEGRVAVLADVLAACVGVASGLPDALGEVEAARVGAVGAEDSVCGEASSVGLVDPCLAGEGFVAAEFGDVREGRVLVVQVWLHGFSPRRVFGHGEDARGGVTRTQPVFETCAAAHRLALPVALVRAVLSLGGGVSASAHTAPPALSGAAGGVGLRVMRLEQDRQPVHEGVHTVR